MNSSRVQHAAVVSLFLLLLMLFVSGAFTKEDKQLNPLEEYGILVTLITYFLRVITLAAVPLSVANFLGIIFFNTFPEPPTLKGSPLLAPFICFRVVTKGDFPELVKDNLRRNMETCCQAGVDNCMFEVVTDKAIHLAKMPGVREIVVPDTYVTSQGSLFKARALQYCLEDGVNMLNDDDWIVHLDEETLLTKNSAIGIFNFVTEGSHHFGQGVITYGSGHVVNWVTTLIDSVRVAIDYGALRFCFKVFHKPIFNWKGSFNVSNVAAERRVNYDHGPEASIAEDCYFGILASSMGYSFGFVEGEMNEQSTFTFVDFMRQRRRWAQGIYLAWKSCPVQHQYKAGIFFLVVAMHLMPLSAVALLLSLTCPVPLSLPSKLVFGFLGAVFLFLFVFGAVKSLNRRRLGLVKYALLCISTLLVIPVAYTLEVSAVIWAIGSNKINFHVVKKGRVEAKQTYSKTETVLMA
ncbi:beta-1,4-mannosyltransferase egh-like [Liolophura sinensis]|uniref:beta-1,4-mannosyltransferase egh-like n=1 Tax=Liolophura sinensis TaxID=3198878 RepID=UPI00315988D7